MCFTKPATRNACAGSRRRQPVIVAVRRAGRATVRSASKQEVKMGLSQMEEFADWRAMVLRCVGFFTLLIVAGIAVRWLL
jgi:hypothetical protein